MERRSKADTVVNVLDRSLQSFTFSCSSAVGRLESRGYQLFQELEESKGDELSVLEVDNLNLSQKNRRRRQPQPSFRNNSVNVGPLSLHCPFSRNSLADRASPKNLQAPYEESDGSDADNRPGRILSRITHAKSLALSALLHRRRNPNLPSSGAAGVYRTVHCV